MSEPKHITDGPFGREWRHEHADGSGTHVHPANKDCSLGATQKTTLLPAPTSKICHRRVAGSDPIGQTCRECGHTDLVHGGVPNPELTACIVCELLELRNRG